MVTTYFNWIELSRIARRDPAAIVVLTYAQTKGYNEPLAWGGKNLLQILRINHVPMFLFQSGILNSVKGKITCTYKTEDPQCYLKNTKFLTYNVSAYDKALYIRALAYRRISEKEDKIPRMYFGEIKPNPFITYDDDFIYFRYESLVSGN